MQLQWPDYARLQVDDTVFCQDPARPYWLWEGVVVSVEPPAIGVYLPPLDTVVFPRCERLHGESAEPDAGCRYCQALAGAWTG